MRTSVAASAIAAGLTAGSLVLGGPGAVAVELPADPTHLHLQSHSTNGSFDYVLRGRVAHAPGNAHSGEISFETGDGEDEAIMNDWRCPTGVTPPPLYNPTDPGTTCTILRSWSVEEGTQQVVPTVGRDMKSARENSTHSVFDNLAEDWLPGQVRSAYVLRGVGPITTTVDTSDPTVLTVVKRRAATVRGRFAHINLDDCRIRISNTLLTGIWTYDEP